MNVKHFIRKTYEVIGPYVKAGSVADGLLKHSFLVIMEEGKFLGVLTAPDIVGRSQRLVIDCLCAKPRLDYESTIESILKLMKESRNSVLPVFKADEFIGVVTQDDIADFLDDYRRDLEEEAARRRQAEEKIRRSEAKWHSLVENAPDIILTTDREGTIQFINRTLPGLSPEQVIGTSVYDYAPAEHHQTVRRALEQVFQTGQSQSYEIAGTGPEGRTSWYRTRAGPIKHGGQVVAATFVVRDITDQKRAEEALLIRSVAIASSINAIAFADRQGNIKYVNKSFLELWGYSDEKEVLGKPAVQFWADVDKAAEVRRILLEEGGWVGELIARRKNGSRFDVELSTTLVKDETGAQICTMGSFVDITERKKAEAALQKKNIAIESAINAIAFGDLDGNITSINKSFLELWGYSDETEVLGKPALQFWAYAGKAGEVKKILLDQGSWIGEVIARKKDGSTFDAQLSSTLVKDETGNHICIMASFLDITERRRAEAALREAEAKYRILVEQIPAVTYIAAIDEASTTLYISPQIEGFIGVSAEEYKANPDIWRQQLHPDDRDRVMDEVKRSHRSGEPLACEYRMRARDGRVVWFRDEATVVRDEKGNPLFLQGIMLDITAGKEADEKLSIQSAALANMSEGVAFIQVGDGRIAYTNERFEKMFGYGPSELLGKHVGILNTTTADKGPEEIFEEITAALHSDGVWRGEIPCVSKDGRALWVRVSLSMLESARYGEVWVGVHEDITERKKAEDQLKSYRAKMARAEQLASVGALSATVAHELTQPLTVIHLSIENILAEVKEMSCSDNLAEGLKDSLGEVSHAVAIVDRLRNFARKSSDKSFGEVSLGRIAKRFLRLLGESAEQAKVTLRLEGIGELPLIYGSESDLEQLFFALIQNAIQAADGKKDREFVISGVAKEEHIELQFADTCGGIAKSNLDRIFEPFFTTKPAGEGTGLGLSIVERIVSAAAGRIRVESEVGKGSTFFVTLPIKGGK